MINIDKKKVAVISLVAVVLMFLLFIFAVIRFNNLDKIPDNPQYFTDQAETWIEDDPDSEEGVMINIHRATNAKSIFLDHKQEYYFGGRRLTFFMHGYYQGNEFSEIYVDPDAFDNLPTGISSGEELAFLEEHALMRNTPNFVPDDGIPEGFIMAREETSDEQPVLVFYIFVDEDWKDYMSYTNIMWGEDLFDKSKMQVREFDFSNGQSGIYVDKINDADWFLEGKRGGIFVGEISLESLDITSQKDLNASFIYLQ
ncbi:hypothetical protein JXC34_05660 [Candidatus Woesearchaeota archaeon]|nr:hypothetical protein [Candidatus Woesearchaeota archaeon]